MSPHDAEIAKFVGLAVHGCSAYDGVHISFGLESKDVFMLFVSCFPQQFPDHLKEVAALEFQAGPYSASRASFTFYFRDGHGVPLPQYAEAVYDGGEWKINTVPRGLLSINGEQPEARFNGCLLSIKVGNIHAPKVVEIPLSAAA